MIRWISSPISSLSPPSLGSASGGGSAAASGGSGSGSELGFQFDRLVVCDVERLRCLAGGLLPLGRSAAVLDEDVDGLGDRRQDRIFERIVAAGLPLRGLCRLVGGWPRRLLAPSRRRLRALRRPVRQFALGLFARLRGSERSQSALRPRGASGPQFRETAQMRRPGGRGRRLHLRSLRRLRRGGFAGRRLVNLVRFVLLRVGPCGGRPRRAPAQDGFSFRRLVLAPGRRRRGGPGRRRRRASDDPGRQQRRLVLGDVDAGASGKVKDLLPEDLGQLLRRVGRREDMPLQCQALDHEEHLPAIDVAPGLGELFGHPLRRLLEVVTPLADFLGEKAEQIGESPRREHRHVGRRVNLARQRLQPAAIARWRGRRFQFRLGFGFGRRIFAHQQIDEGFLLDHPVGDRLVAPRRHLVGVDHGRAVVGSQPQQHRCQIRVGGQKNEFFIAGGMIERLDRVENDVDGRGIALPSFQRRTVDHLEAAGDDRRPVLAKQLRIGIAAADKTAPPRAVFRRGRHKLPILDRRNQRRGSLSQKLGNILTWRL